MAKKDSKGEYICEHCDATDMRVERIEQRGSDGKFDRLHLICNKCGEKDVYDSVPK